MVPSMWDIIMMEKSRERENIIGLMDPIMMGNGMITRLMVSVPTNGLTVEDIQELGRKTTCMARVLMSGRMEGSMLGNIKMIKSMVKELIIGLMEDVMKVDGKMAISTERRNIT